MINYLNFYLILVQDGDYYRLLTDGHYRVTASMEGFLPVTKLITVMNKPFSEAQILNFSLNPVSFIYIILLCINYILTLVFRIRFISYFYIIFIYR